jgi:hypothetical protein
MMTTPLVWLTVSAILFISTFVRGTLGFGNALLAMPLLALTVGIRVATPLVALSSFTVAMLMLLGSWRNVEMQSAWRLVVASFLGIPLGLWLLQDAPEALVKGVLGVVLVFFGLFNLTTLRLPRLTWKPAAFVFGFLAGVLGGAYNTNGPPVIVYGVLTRWTPEQMRATLQGYFLPAGIFILTGHGLAGLWTAEVLRFYVLTLPLVLVALLAGSRLSRVLPPGRFDRLVYASLVLMGMLLIV